jgi:hypothetical protein
VSSPNFIRWCGLAAALAGVLLLVSDILGLLVFDFEGFGAPSTTGAYVVIAGLFLVAALLFSLGLVGLYASQAEATGLLGLLGFLAAFVGTTLVAGTFWAQAFLAPAVAETDPEFFYNGQSGWLNFGLVVSYAFFALGWLLFGVATFRARVHPRWAAVLLMIGAVLLVLPLPFTSIVFDAAVAWLGFGLFTGKGEADQPSTRATDLQEDGSSVKGG